MQNICISPNKLVLLHPKTTRMANRKVSCVDFLFINNTRKTQCEYRLGCTEAVQVAENLRAPLSATHS